MKKGRLIVFTGIDGSGKTTQADLLLKSLQNDGIDAAYVWSRWEPLLLRAIINRWKKSGDGESGSVEQNYNELKSKKKKLLDNPIIRWLWLFLFFIDYSAQIFIKIGPVLRKRELIISDRIFYDSVIDQAINLGGRKSWLLNSLDSFWMKLIFPEPDMVIYVDCPADIAFSRKEDAPNVEYLEERRTLYLELTNKYGWVKVDGTLSIDEIAGQINQIAKHEII